MKKAALLGSATALHAPIAIPTKGTKPIPMIGTMQKSATPEQRKAFTQMKHQMKDAARRARYEQHLQEKETRDKP